MSERTLQGVQTPSRPGTWELDLNAWKVNWDPEVFQILGLAPGSYTPDVRDFQKFILPEDQEEILAHLTPILETGGPFAFDTRIQRATGELRFVHSQGELVRGANDDPLRFRGIVEDITERRLAEQALRETDAQTHLLVEAVKDHALIMLDPQGRVGTWNRGAERIQGYLASEIVGEHCSRFYPADAVATGQPQGALQQALEHGRHEEECLRIRKDGSRYWAQVTLTPIFSRDQQHLGFAEITQDITERKRAEKERQLLEAQLQQTQKLRSLGVLAGGIAHDFNNLLTAVLGYASLALMHLPDDSVVRPMLREIEQAAHRAAELTQQMLAYSGGGKFVIQPLRLEALVQEMTRPPRTVLPAQATLELKLEAAPMAGDPTQIRQLISNLLTNAADALGGAAGVVRVRTGLQEVDAAHLRSPFIPEQLPAGRYAFLEIEDTGCGMSEETRLCMFDPFFSTKFMGRGLGLPAVLGIIRGHQGTIQVASTPGQGTTVEVLFPCVPAGGERETVAHDGRH